MSDTPEKIVEDIRIADRMCADLKGDEWRAAYKTITEAPARIQTLIDAAVATVRQQRDELLDALKAMKANACRPYDDGKGDDAFDIARDKAIAAIARVEATK